MSSSHPGRILGSASSTVTLVPRSVIIEANSHPMAPPPMTAAVAGSGCSDSSSSEVSTIWPSTSKPGMVRGTEPEAMHDGVAVQLDVARLAPETVTTWSAPKRAHAVEDGDLAPLEQGAQPARPAGRRPSACAPGSRRSPSSARLLLTPKAAAPATARRMAAVSSSSLAGMHPTFRQVPPSLPFSIRAIDEPGRRPVERGGVAARAAADDDDIEALGRGDHLPDRVCACNGGSRGTGADV